MSALTIERQVHFQRGRRTRKVIEPGPPAEPAAMPKGTIPRISRLMALALRFDRLIRAGEITDQADLARLGHVTRARVTQIMNLLQLAPDIQEAVLFLPRTTSGRDPIREVMVRPIAAQADWRNQRRMWKCLTFDQGIGSIAAANPDRTASQDPGVSRSTRPGPPVSAATVSPCARTR